MPENPRIILSTGSDAWGTAEGFRIVAEDFEKETGIKVEVQNIDAGMYKIWVNYQFISKDPPTILLTGEREMISMLGHNGLLVRFEVCVRVNPFL